MRVKDHRFTLIYTPNESVKISDKIRVNLWINLLFNKDTIFLRISAVQEWRSDSGARLDGAPKLRGGIEAER